MGKEMVQLKMEPRIQSISHSWGIYWLAQKIQGEAKGRKAANHKQRENVDSKCSQKHMEVGDRGMRNSCA